MLPHVHQVVKFVHLYSRYPCHLTGVNIDHDICRKDHGAFKCSVNAEQKRRCLWTVQRCSTLAVPWPDSTFKTCLMPSLPPIFSGSSLLPGSRSASSHAAHRYHPLHPHCHCFPPPSLGSSHTGLLSILAGKQPNERQRSTGGSNSFSAPYELCDLVQVT